MQPVTINGRAIRINADTAAVALIDVVKALTQEPSRDASKQLTRMLKESQLSGCSEKAINNGKDSAKGTAGHLCWWRSVGAAEALRSWVLSKGAD